MIFGFQEIIKQIHFEIENIDEKPLLNLICKLTTLVQSPNENFILKRIKFIYTKYNLQMLENLSNRDVQYIYDDASRRPHSELKSFSS